MQGRQDTFPKRRGITRVKELTEAGVNVSLGQDSMQDPWYPLGNGNMMLILDYVLHLAQMMSFEEIDDALKFLTVNGATTLGPVSYTHLALVPVKTDAEAKKARQELAKIQDCLLYTSRCV